MKGWEEGKEKKIAGCTGHSKYCPVNLLFQAHIYAKIYDLFLEVMT